MTKLKTRLLKDLPIKTTPVTDDDYVVNTNNGTTKLKVKDITKNLETNVNKLNSDVKEILEKGTTVEVLERVTKQEIDRQIADGTIANLTIAPGSITKDKLGQHSVTQEKIHPDVKLGVQINDDNANQFETWSSKKIDNELNKVYDVEEKNTISPLKLKRINGSLPSINLFNKETTIDGQCIDNNGNWIGNKIVCESDFIRVESGQRYTWTRSAVNSTINAYDERFNRVGFVGSSVHPIAEGVCYLRFAMGINEKDTFMVVKGTTLPSKYVEHVPEKYILDNEYYEYPLPKNVVADENISKDGVSPSVMKHVKRMKINMFNPKDITEGGYLSPDNGGFTPNTEFCVSNFIEVEPNEKYSKTHSSNHNTVTFYDVNRNRLSSINSSNFTTPAKCAYIRVGVVFAERFDFKLCKGAKLLDDIGEWLDTKQEYAYFFDKDFFNLQIKDSDKNNENYDAVGAGTQLFIETYYDGGNQPMHPKILDMGVNKWNGYRFWMCYSPLPFYNEDEENPCIAVSNDLIKWETPGGDINLNPLDRPQKTKENYLSDPHLVYNDVTRKMEIWYRGYSKAHAEYIYRVTSSDGVHWSSREELFTYEVTEPRDNATSFLSPTVIFNGTDYDIWVARRKKDDYIGTIVKYKSVDGKNWVYAGDTNINGTWHFDIIKTDKGYEMLNYHNRPTTITWWTSDDGMTWIKPTQNTLGEGSLLSSQKGSNILPPWSNFNEFYRSTFLKIKGIYYVFISRSHGAQKWHLTLAISQKMDDISTIKELDYKYTQHMSKPTQKPKFGDIGDTFFIDGKPIFCKESYDNGQASVWVDANGDIV